MARQRACPQCGHPRSRKACHSLVYRTPFGKLRLDSPRLYRCRCEPHGPRSFSPLAERLPNRSSPELICLETRFAGLMSYGLTVAVLKEVLQISQDLCTAAIRKHVTEVAGRLESELGDECPAFIDGCPAEWGTLPDPPPPLCVGLDGGYVHACNATSKKEGWFEVIVGKSLAPEEGVAKGFGFVSRHDTKPRRRLF